jgi:hypothetical protein
MVFIKALENALNEIIAVVHLLERKNFSKRSPVMFEKIHKLFKSPSVRTFVQVAGLLVPVGYVEAPQTGGWFAFVAAHTIVL